jgi:hypothetical protein
LKEHKAPNEPDTIGTAQEELQPKVFPISSVIVTTVLLKLAET